MSYSIIYQTKVIKLPDGRLIHLTRQGCNNDDEGRVPGEYRSELYTPAEFEEFIQGFEKADNSCSPEIKIGSRRCPVSAYGKHLRTMLNRAETWDDLLMDYAICNAKIFKGVRVETEKEEIYYTPAEWDLVCYDYYYGRKKGHVYYDVKVTSDINVIVKALEEGKHAEFHVHCKRKRIAS